MEEEHFVPRETERATARQRWRGSRAAFFEEVKAELRALAQEWDSLDESAKRRRSYAIALIPDPSTHRWSTSSGASTCNPGRGTARRGISPRS